MIYDVLQQVLHFILILEHIFDPLIALFLVVFGSTLGRTPICGTRTLCHILCVPPLGEMSMGRGGSRKIITK